MFYIRWETPSQKPRAWKLRNWKWSWYMYRCKPARAPLFSCAHSIVKLRAMVIHVRVYARRLTIHIHFTQAQACRNYRYMPRSWPYTELRNGKKRGIDQSETSSHLTHLIYNDMDSTLSGTSQNALIAVHNIRSLPAHYEDSKLLPHLEKKMHSCLPDRDVAKGSSLPQGIQSSKLWSIT